MEGARSYGYRSSHEPLRQELVIHNVKKIEAQLEKKARRFLPLTRYAEDIRIVMRRIIEYPG